MTELNHSTAVITGGAMGIGFETSKLLLKNNCSVTIWDVNDEQMEKAKIELSQIGPPVYFHNCDVTNEDQVNKMAKLAIEEMGQVDILINNAGCVVPGRFCSNPPSVRAKETEVNLISMFYTIYAFLPDMYKRNKGHVVNISSGAGLLGMPDLSVYCATKFAVFGFTESLRLEANIDNKDGVKFSSVHPGIIKQGMFEGSKLNALGELLIPRVNNHSEIAEQIINRALKNNHNVVKYPKSLHVGTIARALIPDFLLARIMILAGAGRIMRDWTGRKRA